VYACIAYWCRSVLSSCVQNISELVVLDIFDVCTQWTKGAEMSEDGGDVSNICFEADVALQTTKGNHTIYIGLNISNEYAKT